MVFIQCDVCFALLCFYDANIILEHICFVNSNWRASTAQQWTEKKIDFFSFSFNTFFIYQLTYIIDENGALRNHHKINKKCALCEETENWRLPLLLLCSCSLEVVMLSIAIQMGFCFLFSLKINNNYTDSMSNLYFTYCEYGFSIVSKWRKCFSWLRQSFSVIYFVWLCNIEIVTLYKIAFFARNFKIVKNKIEWRK